MSEVSGEFVSIEAVSPGVFDDLFFEDGIGGIFLPVGAWISAGVVVDHVERAPEAHTSEEGTVSHQITN